MKTRGFDHLAHIVVGDEEDRIKDCVFEYFHEYWQFDTKLYLKSLSEGFGLNRRYYPEHRELMGRTTGKLMSGSYLNIESITTFNLLKGKNKLIELKNLTPRGNSKLILEGHGFPGQKELIGDNGLKISLIDLAELIANNVNKELFNSSENYLAITLTACLGAALPKDSLKKHPENTEESYKESMAGQLLVSLKRHNIYARIRGAETLTNRKGIEKREYSKSARGLAEINKKTNRLMLHNLENLVNTESINANLIIYYDKFDKFCVNHALKGYEVSGLSAVPEVENYKELLMEEILSPDIPYTDYRKYAEKVVKFSNSLLSKPRSIRELFSSLEQVIQSINRHLLDQTQNNTKEYCKKVVELNHSLGLYYDKIEQTLIENEKNENARTEKVTDPEILKKIELIKKEITITATEYIPKILINDYNLFVGEISRKLFLKVKNADNLSFTLLEISRYIRSYFKEKERSKLNFFLENRIFKKEIIRVINFLRDQIIDMLGNELYIIEIIYELMQIYVFSSMKEETGPQKIKDFKKETDDLLSDMLNELGRLKELKTVELKTEQLQKLGSTLKNREPKYGDKSKNYLEEFASLKELFLVLLE